LSPERELQARVISELLFPQPLRLFDATSPGIYRIGFSPDVVESDDYSPSQDWASRIQKAGFDGVAFSSAQRHVGSLFGIFGNAGTGTRTSVSASFDISERIVEALGILGIRVFPIPSSADLDIE
jgi:hypothetical protein